MASESAAAQSHIPGMAVAVRFNPAMVQDGELASKADALADALSRLGFNAVTMRGEDQAVPRGYFRITDMFKTGSDTYNSRPDTKKPKGTALNQSNIRTNDFIRSKLAQNQASLIAQTIGGSTEKHVHVSFTDGPYKGTWVHPELAVLAAVYLDKATAENGQLGVIMARALMIVTSAVPQANAAAVSIEDKLEAVIVGLRQDMQVERDMFRMEINKRPKVAQVDKEVIMAIRNESHAALAQQSKAMQDMSAEQRSMREQMSMQGEQAAKSMEKLAEQWGEQTAELVGQMHQSTATLAPSHSKKRSFTMMEAAKEAAPSDPERMVHLLHKTGQLAMNTNFQSMMDLIPIKLGMKPIGERDGAPLYYSGMKPSVVEMMQELDVYMHPQ